MHRAFAEHAEQHAAGVAMLASAATRCLRFEEHVALAYDDGSHAETAAEAEAEAAAAALGLVSSDKHG